MSCFSYFVFYLWSLGLCDSSSLVSKRENQLGIFIHFQTLITRSDGELCTENPKMLIFSFIWFLNCSENQGEDKSSKFCNTWRNHLYSPYPPGAWKIHPAGFKMWRQAHFNIKIFPEDGPCLVCVLPHREILRHLNHFQQTVPQMSKKQITN